MSALRIILVAATLLASAVAAEPPDHLRWHRYEAPEFPPALNASLVREGFAVLTFTFDDDGHLTDRLVLAASHPAFNAAVLEAAREWRIDTAGLSSSRRRESHLRRVDPA